MTALRTATEIEPEAGWIVCLGATREVRRGRVACPLRRRRVDIEVCLDCRHLTWWGGERDRSACSAPLGPPEHPFLPHEIGCDR